MKLVIILIVMLAFSVSNSFADSTGYYCVNTKYLAYELNSSEDSRFIQKLSVIYFGTDHKNDPPWIEYPWGQVHGMKCLDDRLEMLSFGKRYVYSITPEKITLIPEKELADPSFDTEDFPESKNLSMFSPVSKWNSLRKFTQLLETEGTEFSYEIQYERIETSDRCKVIIQTDLVKLDQEINIVKVIPIFKGEDYIGCS